MRHGLKGPHRASWTTPIIGIVVCIGLASASPAANAGFIQELGVGPYARIGPAWGAPAVSVRSAIVVDDFSESKANANGSAFVGPCVFSISDDRISVTSDWYASINAPRGKASGSTSCSVEFELQVPDVIPQQWSLTYGSGPQVDVSFNPLNEIAHYGWSIGGELLSSNHGNLYFGEGQDRTCDSSDYGYSYGYDCVNAFDDNQSEYPSGRFTPGEILTGKLWVRFHFDLRSTVSEPGTFALLSLGLLGLAFTARRKH